MNKKRMLTTLIVTGALVTPAARADHAESDWCSHYCGLIDRVLSSFDSLLAIPQSDRPLDTDKASDRSGRDIARTDAKALGGARQGIPQPVDGRDSAPSGGDGYRLSAGAEGDPDVICLGCGGLPSPKDGSN
jgi:hypothetical protein